MKVPVPPQPANERTRDGGRLLLIALTVLAVVAAPGLLRIVGREPTYGDNHQATGYNRIIELFGARGWLIAHRNDEDPDQKVVTVSRRIMPEIKDFYRYSFLRGDVESDNPALWRFTGARGVRGVEPGAHSIIGPFAQTRAWRGDVLFRGQPGSQARLLGPNGVQLVFLPPARAWSMTAAARPHAEVSPFTMAGAAGQIIEGSNFRFLDPAGNVMASALLVGNRVVIRVEDGAEGTVVVDHATVKPRANGVAFKALEINKPVKLVADGREASFRMDVSTTGLSIYQSPEVRRRAASAASFAVSIESAMARLIQLDPSSDPDRWLTQPVKTSLDEPLQDEAQTLLRDYSRTLRSHLPDSRTFRSAALVMDARTGEILAAASFPTDTSDLTGAEASSLDALSMLRRNHNLTRLNIGSVAKIPLSTVILDTYPSLGTLVVEGAGGPEFAELLGQPLEFRLPELSGANPVNFQDFIRTSSNKFACSLMLLASAPDPTSDGDIPAGEGYLLEGRHHSYLPKDAFHTRRLANGHGKLVRDGLSPTVRMRWVPRLNAFFDLPHVADVGSRGEPAQDGADVYDLSPWRGLVGNHTAFATRGFLEASPERESFAMGITNNLRNDYLQLMLGGGRSRWTTVKVAEVFSRIVTGERVSATFLARDNPVHWRSMPFENPATRDTMLSAMETVWQGGTARLLEPRLRALQARAPAGEVVRIFAKTGTPTLERVRASSTNLAVNELIELRIVRIGQDTGLITVLRAGGRGRAQIARALEANEDARDILRRHQVSAAQAAAYVEGLNGALKHLVARDEDNSFYLQPDLLPERGNGGVVAFTIARYRIGENIPVRALTVVINVQAKLPEDTNLTRRNPGTELADQWLAHPRLGQLLFEDPGRPSAASASAVSRGAA